VATFFSSALRQARLLHQFTLDHAAGAAGVTSGHLSRVERGYVALTPELARRLSKLYRIRIYPSPSVGHRPHRERRAAGAR
jgi:transcriptional regulator with XRE-family HTH domain